MEHAPNLLAVDQSLNQSQQESRLGSDPASPAHTSSAHPSAYYASLHLLTKTFYASLESDGELVHSCWEHGKHISHVCYLAAMVELGVWGN